MDEWTKTVRAEPRWRSPSSSTAALTRRAYSPASTRPPPAMKILPNMSRLIRDTPWPFQPPVTQRDTKTEVAHCVGGVASPLPRSASHTRTVGTNDRVAPPNAARRTVTKAGQRAQLREYPVDHFDVYQGTWQQRALADQLDFLSQRAQFVAFEARQACAAATAALNVLLGRITAVVISLSGW